MLLYFQEPEQTPVKTFDPDIIWQVFAQLTSTLLARVPYILLGLLTFVVFIIVARILKSILTTAGRRTRLESARSVIHDVLNRTEGVLENPEPWVYVSELAPSSVNFSVFFWTNPQQAQVLLTTDKVITGIKLNWTKPKSTYLTHSWWSMSNSKVIRILKCRCFHSQIYTSALSESIR